jgi:hypothetical protein
LRGGPAPLTLVSLGRPRGSFEPRGVTAAADCEVDFGSACWASTVARFLVDGGLT